MPAGAFAHFHNYGPASFAIEVEGGDTHDVDVRCNARLGVQTEGGNQEPSLHGTLLVGNGVEIEGTGEVEAFGLRGDIFIGVDVDIAAQPTVFDIVQGVLNAMASQYNIAGTIGNKINSAGSGGVDNAALAAAVLAAAEANPIHANVKEVNSLTVDGTGTESDPWGPV